MTSSATVTESEGRVVTLFSRSTVSVSRLSSFNASDVAFDFSRLSCFYKDIRLTSHELVSIDLPWED